MNVAKIWKGKSNKTSFNFQYPGKTYSRQNCHIKEKKALAIGKTNKNAFLFFPRNIDYTSYLFKSLRGTDKFNTTVFSH